MALRRRRTHVVWRRRFPQQACLWLVSTLKRVNDYSICFGGVQFSVDNLYVRVFKISKEKHQPHFSIEKREGLYFCVPAVAQLSVSAVYDFTGYFLTHLFADSKTVFGNHVHRHWRQLIPGQLPLLSANYYFAIRKQTRV